MQQLLGKVSDFVSKIACREYSVVKLELSLGKQTFSARDGAPPASFSLPDACRRANGQKLGEFFNNARFVDKAATSVCMEVEQRLLADGFQLQQKTALRNRKSVDVYWRNLESKDRLMTKLHVDTETGQVDLVHASFQKFKPIVITFMHPELQTDFRIRVTVRMDAKGDAVPQEIADLVKSSRVVIE